MKLSIDMIKDSLSKEKIDEAKAIAKNLNSEGETREIYKKATKAYMKNGFHEEAQKTAEELSSNYSIKIRALIKAHQWNRDEANNIALTLDSEELKVKVLKKIAIIEGKQNFDEAKKIAKKIDNVIRKWNILAEIALIEAKAWNIEQAKKTTKEIEVAFLRADSFIEIEKIEKSWDLSEAKIAANDIRNYHAKASAISTIAIMEVMAWNIEQATLTAETINQIKDVSAYHRENVYKKIAIVEANKGNFERAKTIAEETTTETKIKTLCEIAKIEGNSDFEQAKITARNLSDDYRKAIALTEIALIEGKNNFSEAKIIIKESEKYKEMRKSCILTEIEIIEANNWNFENAKIAARKIPNLEDYSKDLENARARWNYKEIERIWRLKRNTYGERKSNMFEKIALLEIQKWDLQNAELTAKEITYGDKKERILHDILMKRTNSGRTKEIKKKINEVKKPSKKIDVLFNITILEANKWNFEEVEKLLFMIKKINLFEYAKCCIKVSEIAHTYFSKETSINNIQKGLISILKVKKELEKVQMMADKKSNELIALLLKKET